MTNVIDKLESRIQFLEMEAEALRRVAGGHVGDFTWHGVIAKGPNGKLTPHNNPQWCWVKPIADTSSDVDSSSLVPVRCRIVPVIGASVKVGNLNGNKDQEVLGLWTDSLPERTIIDGSFSTPLHGSMHKWAKSSIYPFRRRYRDSIDVDDPNILMLRTDPSISGGGLRIDVHPYGDFNGNFGIDLTGYVPTNANEARFVCVYLNVVTGLIQLLGGTVVVDNVSVIPPKPVPPEAKVVISSYVRLAFGQTGINDGDVKPGRDFLRSGDTIPPRVQATFVDMDAPTPAEKLALGVKPGQVVWQNGTVDNPENAWIVDGNGDLSRVTEFVNLPYRAAGGVGAGGLQSQPKTNDAIAVTADLHFKQRLILADTDGDTPLAKLSVHQDSVTAYTNVVPNATTLPVYFRNSSPHVAGGVYTGMQFNLSGDGLNRIVFFGAVTESDTLAGTSFVICTNDNFGVRAEKVRVLGSGYMGLNESNPASRLHLFDDHSANDILRVVNTTNGPSARCGIRMTGDGGEGFIYYRSQGSTFIPDVLQIASSKDTVINPGNGAIESVRFVATTKETQFKGYITVSQPGVAVTQPVVALTQANDTEDFIEYRGKSVPAVLDKTLVAAADVASSTIAGWRKIVVFDDNGNLTDGSYYEPYYSISAV